MVTFPGLTPVTIPDELTVATDEFEETQEPPAVPFEVSVTVLPAQTDKLVAVIVPDIGGDTIVGLKLVVHVKP
jgi:hypothetical protein